MLTGPESVLSDIISSVDEQGTYEVESSILLSGIFDTEDDLRSWAAEHGLRYEMSEIPARSISGKKIVTFSRDASDALQTPNT
jgi:hypothetical protein